MKKIFSAIAVSVALLSICLVAGGGLYVDGEPISAGNLTAILTMSDTVEFGHAGQDGQVLIYSEQGATDYKVSLNPNATMTSSADFYLPADEPAAQSLLSVSSGGVMSWASDSADIAAAVDDETGNGVLVFNNSPTFTDDVQLGADGASGELKVFSEQGGTDYTASLFANTAMTSDALFYLPADEPAGTYLLTMTTGGVIDYDSSTYLTAEADDIDDVCERGAATDVEANFQVGIVVGEAATTTGTIKFEGATSGETLLTAADAAGSGTLTLPITTGTIVCTGDTGTVTASMIQAAAADLGAADVEIDLGNTNGSYVTNITTDGNVTADETRAEPIIGGGSGAFAGIRAITETVTISVGDGADPVVETSGNLAPANSLLLGATSRVTQAPGGGATMIDIGVTGSGNLDSLVDGMSTVLDTTATTPADGDGTQMPLTNAADATLTVTTDADVTVSDMIIKVTVWYLVFSAQTS